MTPDKNKTRRREAATDKRRAGDELTAAGVEKPQGPPGLWHMALAIDYFESMSDAVMQTCLLPGHTPQTVRPYLAELKRRGFTYMPPCDRFDRHGLCRGHETTPLSLITSWEQFQREE